MTREGPTTQVLRTTMDLPLEEVNTRLIASGEKAVTPTVLVRRRTLIRAKDTVRMPTNQTKPTINARPAQQRPTQPRPGTFADFVYNQPYDLNVHEVLARARAKGFPTKSYKQVYKVRLKYPKPTTVAPATSGEPPTVSAPKALGDSNNAKNKDQLRNQFLMLARLIGLDEALALLNAEYRYVREQLASLSE